MVKSRPPLAGLVWLASAFPGLRAALRRFTPGYCSIGASGAQYKCINSRGLSNSSWITAHEESKNEEIERQILTISKKSVVMLLFVFALE